MLISYFIEKYIEIIEKSIDKVSEKIKIIIIKQGDTQMNSDYDVIVVGAGSAGWPAALQASMTGMKTLLIEKSGMPGGTTTVAGVDFPGLFHAWGKQVVKGVGWKLVEKCVRETGASLPDFSRDDLPHWMRQVSINKFYFACLLDEAFRDAGTDVLYHSMISSVKDGADGVDVKVACKDGLRQFCSRILIDCSGDANAVELAGYPLHRNAEKQPGTLIVKFSGYEIGKIDLEEIDKDYLAAVDAGTLKATDSSAHSMASLLHGNGVNCIHIPIEDASSSAGRSVAESDARAAVLRIFRFLKGHKGLENLSIEYMASECGIRETAVIKGITTITVEDYVAGRKWPDSLCNAFYSIDLHLNSTKGLDLRPLVKGIVPTVPAAALIPEKSHSLLVAGRCVSSDQLANSGLRVQASCMAMGQSAGALAVIACRTGKSPAEADIKSVKALLSEFDAIVP